MRRICAISTLFILLLTACAHQPTWQEQYDLGMRYLSEGNYEEAVIAFTAAIEIDPKRAEAYVGRGNAYIGCGETEENLTAAQTDFEKAIKLDETIVEAYLGLADVYIRKENFDDALEVLQEGREKAGENEAVEQKIKEIENHIAEAEESSFPSDARRAYAQKVQELAMENEEFRFALVDLTENSIPELVVDLPGYYIGVFVYDGDKAVQQGENYWPYGAFGNLGYEYLPGKNVIRNYNNDYAGIVQYETYYTISENEISLLSNNQLSIHHFVDVNRNGYPDENEEYTDESFYFVDDNEVSEDIYASYQIKGDFEWLNGDKSVNEMMDLLRVGYDTVPPQGTSVESSQDLLSIAEMLGCVPDDLYNTFGAPIYGTPVNGEMFEGGEYYGYEGITFLINHETNTVCWIAAEPEVIKFNGSTFDQTRPGLIELLGEPESEGSYYDELDDENIYEMHYIFNGLDVIIQMEDIDSLANAVIISQSVV